MVLKKKAAVFLVLCFMFNFIACTFAATESQIKAGEKLKDLDILHGYADGSLGLDRNITRAEIAALLVSILSYADTNVAGSANVSFKDVKSGEWHEEWIKKAAALGMVSGYEDKTFRPQQNITFAECLSMMVRATKNDKDLKGNWPQNYISKAKALGIIAENNNTNANKKLTRGEVAEIIWNSLLVKFQ